MPSVGQLFSSNGPSEPLVAPHIFILTAVAGEAWAVRKAVADLKPTPPVSPIGIRAVRPRPSLRGVQLLMMAGLAGALDPLLKVGDVVLDDPAGVIDVPLPLRRGRVHSGVDLLASPAAKAGLFASTGALAVDMEQATAFTWARQAGIACIGVRAIRDTAGDALDPALLNFVNEMGEVRPLPLIAGLLLRPARIRSLLQLRRNAAAANRQLGAAVRQIVQSWKR